MEAVLADRETLSQFVEASVRASVERRRMQAEFVPFGRSGYVALFEIEDDAHVAVLAVRHQLEDDCD